jgi:hypothetical protein
MGVLACLLDQATIKRMFGFIVFPARACDDKLVGSERR